MKLFYSFFGRTIITAVLLITLNTSLKAQPTTLVAGDIAFTGYHGATAAADSFSFVLLKAVNAGTLINFTDNAWLNPGVFRAVETHFTLTTVALPAGREVVIGLISGTSTARQEGNGTSAGTISYTAGPNPMAFATTGDQVIAYQGTVASPTIIAAIHMNVYSTDVLDCANTTTAAWDPDCIDGSGGTVGNSNFSKMPAGLTGGTNAVWIGTVGVSSSEQDNAKFTGCALPLGTAAQVRAAVNNSANWTVSNNTNPPGFLLGANCAFMGLFPLPVKLESFTGKLNSDKTVTLQWKVSEQQDVQQYIIEESADGNSYNTLGSVAPGAGDTYSLIDQQVSPGKNYYRLKTTELSGKITYSNVIVINLKAGIVISLYPNPVTDKLTIQQFGAIQNKTAVLTDQQGRVLQQISLTSLQQTVSMERYAAGVYMLKMADGSTYKIVKE